MERMQFHEFLREQYRANRYLEYLSDDELKQRAMDIFVNLLTLTEEGKIGHISTDEVGKDWMTLWTHVLEEFELRVGQFPAGFENGFMREAKEQIPKYRWRQLPKAVEELRKHKLTQDKYLIKYGKHQYLSPVYQKGSIRITPASFYDDPSLNPAIRDSELELVIHKHPSTLRMKAHDKRTGRSMDIMPEDLSSNVKLSFSSSDYYAFCLSTTYDLRLFGDFESDSCLIIKAPKEFVQSLTEKFREKLPGWKSFHGLVSYVDPIRSGPKQVEMNMFFSKHFRYAYQKEYRVVWLPPNIKNDFDHVYLELGSLANHCELICLK